MLTVVQSIPAPRRPALRRLPRSTSPLLSVVMPAYNEAQNLPRTLDALVDQLPQWVTAWEIVVVDDGSRDATWSLLSDACRWPGLRALRLSRNFGKEAALTAGLAHARGDLVLLMDADGQHPVAMLGQMLQAWREGADAVCAVRQSRDDEGWAKRVFTRWFYRVVNAGSPVVIPADAGDFRLLDRCVVDALNALPERNRFMKGLYAWVGFETRLLPYMPAPRAFGSSSFSLRRLARLAFTGITAFSNLPLRLWSALGGLIALGALGYGVWIVAEHFIEGHPLPGWPTLVAGLMFFSGVQLLSIGILGEYIGRIFDEVKQRPVYVLREDTALVAPGTETAGADAWVARYEPAEALRTARASPGQSATSEARHDPLPSAPR